MWYYNYGEWTEAYVFLKLLGSGIIFGADVNFEKPYNQDTLEFLDVLFNHGLMQKIYRLIKMEYSNPEIQKALFNFIMDAWNEKIRQG